MGYADTERVLGDHRHFPARVLLASLAAALVAYAIAAPSALAGTTNASIFTKSGTDSATNSTATATSTTGVTAAGDTIDWVLGYENTTGGIATTTITDPLGANQAFVSGSLQTPPDLAPGWSTNGGTSYASPEPASGVNAIKASGTTIGNGSLVMANAPSGGINAGSSNGDGWEPIFIGNDVYNIHHHRGATSTDTTVDCHVKATGAECPGYPAAGGYASPTAGAAFNTGSNTLDTATVPNAVYNANGQIFYPVGVNNGTGVGIECIDVLTQTSCGYTQVGNASNNSMITNAAGDAEAMIIGAGGVGSKMYVVTGEPGAPVYCVDTSTSPPSSCGGPVQSDPTYVPGAATTTGSIFNSGAKIYGHYLFTSIRHGDGTIDIGCVDLSTNVACPNFPLVNTVTTTQTAPILDAAGNLTGICGRSGGGSFTCWNLAGTSIGAPPWGVLVPGSTNINSDGALVLGTRIYLAYYSASLAATYACYDFSTNSPCPGFVQASSGQVVRAYTLRQDPSAPDCIWELGDAGVFEVFSATFGGTTCNESNATDTVAPSRSYCDGKSGHVTGWNQINLYGLASTDYAAVAVTITDANGHVVPGWQSRVFTSSQVPIDISSIPYSGSTTTLHVSVAISWGSHTPKVARIGTTWKGDPEEVCFKTTVGQAKCTADQSITNEGNAVTVGTNGVSDGPAGNNSGTATFLLPSNPNLKSCQADLSIEKSADGTSVRPGGQVMYTLVVQNHGPDTATDARASDAIPAGLTIVSAQPAQGACTTSGAVDCSLGSIRSGGTVQILVTANVAADTGGTINNCADTSAFQSDPNKSNNSSCAPIHVVPPPPVPPPTPKVDVQVIKTVNHHVAKFGEVLTYTLVVKNNGPDVAPNVGLTDTSTLAMKVVSITPAQGTCVKSVPFTCKLGAVGAGKTVRITIRAIPNQSGDEINTVSTTPGCDASGTCPPDTNPKNNVSAADTTVKPRITLVKTVSRHLVRAGHEVTYHLTVSDPTPVTVHHVRVCDRMPLGVVFISSTPHARLTAGQECWSLGDLGAHRSKTIKLVARALPGASGRRVNHATATADGVPAVHAQQFVRVIPAPRAPTPVTG